MNTIKSVGELSVEEQLKKYPRLKPLRNQYLFITYSEMDEIRNSDYIYIHGAKNINKNKKVSLYLLNKILTDDKYYNYTKNVFLNTAKTFKLGCIKNGDITNQILLGSRIDILNTIKEAMDKGFLVLAEESKNKYDELYSLVSYSSLKEKNKNNVFEFNIKKELYAIPINLFFDFLEYDDKEYETFFKDKTSEFCGINKKVFIYGLVIFFKENNILKNYVIPDKIYERYYEILSYKKIDVEILFRKEDDYSSKYSDLNKVTIEQNLREKIFEKMSNNFTPLQKAIYIYIKMCMLLSYDEEYFAFDQEGAVTLKHKDIENLSNINLNNIEVVCYEFNALYAKFLTELGIDYEIDGNISCSFGDGHQSLIFYWDKFIVSADSVTSILDGDLVNAKINNKLKGLKCINKNEDTKKEFELLVNRIYQLIVVMENQNHQQTSSFDDLIDMYKHLSIKDNNVNISMEEKVKILIDKVNSLKKSSVDAMDIYLS